MSSSTSRPLSKQDFETLSDFRYHLRRFLRASEDLIHSEGITPLQYQLLLHIKGYAGREWATVGELAERLQASPQQSHTQGPLQASDLQQLCGGCAVCLAGRTGSSVHQLG